MSRENLDLVRRFAAEFDTHEKLARVASGETDVSGYLHPDLEIVNFSEGPITAPYCGAAGVQEWVRESFSESDDVWIEAEEVIDAAENTVVALVLFHGTFRLSGLPIDMRVAAVYRLREGSIVRMEGYLDPEQAHAAATRQG